MAETEKGVWNFMQNHLGYSHEEMKKFRENPRNADVLSKAAALMDKTIVLEVWNQGGATVSTRWVTNSILTGRAI